ncbi:hypothetical protein H7F51_14385 [Novosphingobium flavum]|uniref:C-deglycosylation enzyme beta subunit n=1 Tax=Novosphingobium flavum TaxID=1778672 RepID=A0A7X1FTI2_9SPHN|nr:DUF6379 domain-containing protein [Novosphingobium flavum]MBC2666706.1 hypothetical protein [Novosphingobium flavum]
MLEKHMVVTRHFNNVYDDGVATGFRLGVRIPYYRGVWLAVISRFELTVDGDAFAPDTLRVAYKGEEYSMEELAVAETVHWDFGDVLTLIAPKAGGLDPGLHRVELALTLLPAFTTIVGRTERALTLVQ